MIKVSVCITTYNLESYIAQTLDSILCQETTFDYEVIVGDDFSTDKTRDILLQYNKLYPNKIILHFQEKNVGVNRNDYDLIHLAKGEYIAWCDGDDYWLTKDKLQKQVDILDKNPEYSCVHTYWVDFYEKNGIKQNVTIKQNSWETELKGNKYVEQFVAGNTSGCRFSSLMYRKVHILDFLKIDPSVYLSVPHKQNDFAIFCILSFYGPFYLLPEYTTVYRIREVSLSFGKEFFKRANYTLAYIYLITYLANKFKINKSIVHDAIRRNVATILYYMYKDNNSASLLSELTNVISKAGYKYSMGQRLLISAIKYRFMYLFTKPLFAYLYKSLNQ